MQFIRLNGNYIELYDSIRELPVYNFNEYNRYLMLDSGIGSGGEAIGKKIGKVMAYLNMKNIEDASKELQNLYHSMTFTISTTNPKMYSFCVLIKAINGKPFGDDLSKERLDKTIKELSRKGLTFDKLCGFLDSVKKKLIASLKPFFQRSAVLRST